MVYLAGASTPTGAAESKDRPARVRACRSGGENRAARLETSVKAYLESLYALEEKVLESLEQLSALPMNPMLEVSLSELQRYHDLLIHHIFLISDRLLDGRKIAPSCLAAGSFPVKPNEWVLDNRQAPSRVLSLSLGFAKK